MENEIRKALVEWSEGEVGGMCLEVFSMAIAAAAFNAGWNAAIDYCMQPVEKEVPAEAATSDEHTNNTCEPILSGREDEVNACNRN